MEKLKTTEASKCVHCHLCQKHCSFLDQYKIDLGDVERLEKLAYHCFLCAKCTEVCPVGIDGKELVQSLRRGQVEKTGGKVLENKYNMLLLEKKNYLFRNHRHATSGSVLFPGCNFPSFYPKTTKALISVLEEKAGIGVIYDCCGKPVAELGLEEEEKKIIEGLEKRLKKAGVTEVIMVCPNCYGYLKPRLSVKVTSIYEKLKELGIEGKAAGGSPVFLPCPDREKKEWLTELEGFLDSPCTVIKGVQCCGLGGCASGKEPELAKGFADKIREQSGEKVYAYCASCAGNLRRNGVPQATHVLTEILGVKEQPDTAKSMLNRMLTKVR